MRQPKIEAASNFDDLKTLEIIKNKIFKIIHLVFQIILLDYQGCHKHLKSLLATKWTMESCNAKISFRNAV